MPILIQILVQVHHRYFRLRMGTYTKKGNYDVVSLLSMSTSHPYIPYIHNKVKFSTNFDITVSC